MLIQKDATGSTNDDARALALDGAPSGTAVLASEQSSGRGRAGRSWLSPAGGLYLSVVLRPKAPPARWGLLPCALGAAAARVLRGEGYPVDVKWPNDLLVGQDKLGGILMETRLDERPFAVVGLGLNLTGAPMEGATSLARIKAPAPAASELAEELRGAFVATLEKLDAGKVGDLQAEVREVCASLGRRVEMEEGWGVAVDVDVDGALLVESDGVVRRVVAGDVRLRWGDAP